MKSIFQAQGAGGNATQQIFDKLDHDLRLLGASSSFIDSTQAGRVIGMEGLDTQQTSQFQTALESLRTSLERVDSDLRTSYAQSVSGDKLSLESYSGLTTAQKQAGLYAGAVGANPQKFVNFKSQLPQSTENNQFVSNFSGAERLSEALEAYDERDNRNAAVYTVTYNLQAARQDEFGEAFFPTVVVPPDQIGFRVSIDLVTIIDDLKRQVTGALDNFNRRNVINSLRDASILRNDLTQLIPVYRTGSGPNTGNFVASSLLTPSTVNNGAGESISTNPLAFNQKFSLLGLSQTDALVAAGLMGISDAIDPAINLSALYLQVTGTVNSATVNEIIKFDVLGTPKTAFTGAVQGAQREMTLVYDTSSLRVSDATLQATGAASVLLASLVSGHYSVRLSISVSGKVNVQTGFTELMAGNLGLVSITTQAGVKYTDMTASAISAIAGLFTGAKFVGYDLDARRTNSNIRTRGQLLDTWTFSQTYSVPLLSALTIPRPLGQGDQTDTSDLNALVTTTRVRTSNAAVTQLQRTETVLKNYVNVSDNAFDVVEVMGVSRFLITPVYVAKTLDFSTQLDSLTANQRIDDIQATIVNQIREIAYSMYRDSGYKAAADALHGGNAPIPTVIIGTDIYLAKYISVNGDLRTLGNSFNVRVVSTLDNRVNGKIYITFGDFSGANDGQVNPLHFGNMGWKPEITLVLPLHRDGQNSKELTVQPSFLHVTNMSVLGVITVTNIPNVVAAKVAIYNKPQA